MPTQNFTGANAGCEGTAFENVLRDCFSCGVITVDFEGTLTSLNPEAQRALHLSAPSKQSLSLESLPPQIASLIREVLKSGKTASNRKIVVSSSTQDPATWSVTAMPVSGKTGNGVVVVLNDFSAAAKLEQNLLRLDRLASVGTLSAGLAHEIKNALVAVKTFVDLLLEKNRDDELCETVRREIGRMDSIVTHMLKYAAPSQPAFAQVRLHEILDHSLRLMKPRIGAKLISLNRDFRAREDWLTGDDNQLEQAFVNLLFNAVDALGEEGALTVSTDLVDAETSTVLHDGKKPGRQLSIRISDTGTGIPPENLQEIFEPFFTTKPRGNGLGLVVTRRIIEDHKGIIRVESRPGKGTAFTILLPADPQGTMR